VLWLALLGVHLAGFVGYNLRLRWSMVKKLDPILLATIMQTGLALPMIPVIFLAPPTLRLFTTGDALLLIGTISLTMALHVTNTKALEHLEASVFSILYNLRLPFTTVLGLLFLDEPLIWLRILGGLLIFSAIFIVQQKGKHSLVLRGMEWGIAAALALSFLNLCEKKLAISGGFLYYFPFGALVTAALMWAYVLIRPGHPPVDFRILIRPDMVQLMAFRAMSGLSFSGALAAGAAISVSNYISGMSVLLMVALGALLLGERDFLHRKIMAVVIAVLGLTAIFAGQYLG